ncbi:MAG: hypothetical protein ACBZ72_13815 [Candidatus Bathyarchaeia archaeon]
MVQTSAETEEGSPAPTVQYKPHRYQHMQVQVTSYAFDARAATIETPYNRHS